MTEPLAHSAREPGARAQSYRSHVLGEQDSEGVVAGARRRAKEMTAFLRDAEKRGPFVQAVEDAATFHDLGKLDPEVQAALGRGRNARLDWDHVDAGVAWLARCGAGMAAWLVRAHHPPGLPAKPVHFPPQGVRPGPNFRRLRGVRREEGVSYEAHLRQIERTDAQLDAMLATHATAIGPDRPASGKADHGLAMRMALSCLVDADHADTAHADVGWTAPDAAPPRWTERLDALDAYVDGLAADKGRDEERTAFRRRVYAACRQRAPDAALIACEGPVGIGKTTAVTAYLIRRAIATGARRLFIVAPYTAILSQTADVLRKALVLDGEQPDAVVAEHHHRAEFDHASARDLATLWSAPVILTTAVQFFETLAACEPSTLRKLHALPGSVVFLDEAHAALPAPLWPQNWRWLRELAEAWSCSFALASGSLARFWAIGDIVGDARLALPELTPPDLAEPMRSAESRRVHFETLGRLDGPEALAVELLGTEGPRLLVMNTVQSAAVMAKWLKKEGSDVLHISTALAPEDRAKILAAVKERLEHDRECRQHDPAYKADWTVVATSLLEAGVDLSFRTCFRERFTASSLIQIAGRANRHFEWSEGVAVYDFSVCAEAGLRPHPAAAIPADILETLFKGGLLAGDFDPAELVTRALRMELGRRGFAGDDPLLKAERDRCYPDVARLGRVIDAETRLVIVNRALRERIIAHDRVPARELLSGSVQIWTSTVDRLGLDPLPGRAELFWWPHAYDAGFLGYMEGALVLEGISRGDAIII